MVDANGESCDGRQWGSRLCGSTCLPCDMAHFCPNCGHARDYDAVAGPEDAPAADHRFCGDAFRCCGVGYSREASFCARCGSSLLAMPPMLWDGPPSSEAMASWSLWIERSLEGADPRMIAGVEVQDGSEEGAYDTVLSIDEDGNVEDEGHILVA